MTAEEIKTILIEKLPGADVHAEDLTGTFDHFEVRVAWTGFQGKGLIEQHQIINRILSGPLEDGRIHALEIKTMASNK